MSFLRTVALLILISMPIVYCTSLSIETYRRVEDINRVLFGVMDFQVRTFHFSAGHKGKVNGCRECMRDVHEYLERLNREYPGTFLE